jgi:hypothetical protein
MKSKESVNLASVNLAYKRRTLRRMKKMQGLATQLRTAALHFQDLGRVDSDDIVEACLLGTLAAVQWPDANKATLNRIVHEWQRGTRQFPSQSTNS